VDKTKNPSDTGEEMVSRDDETGMVPQQFWSARKLGDMVDVKGGNDYPKATNSHLDRRPTHTSGL
jgi:hypothetical protein